MGELDDIGSNRRLGTRENEVICATCLLAKIDQGCRTVPEISAIFVQVFYCLYFSSIFNRNAAVRGQFS